MPVCDLLDGVLTEFPGLAPFPAAERPDCLGREVSAGWLRFGSTSRPFRVLSPPTGGPVWLVDDPVLLVEVYVPATYSPRLPDIEPEVVEVPLALRVQRPLAAEGVCETVYPTRGLALCFTGAGRVLRVRAFVPTDLASYRRTWLTLAEIRFLPGE
jgi:hypothetical protein